jgi:hypothetical protein
MTIVPFGVWIVAVAVLPAAAGAGGEVGQPAPPATLGAELAPALALGVGVALAEQPIRSATTRALTAHRRTK